MFSLCIASMVSHIMQQTTTTLYGEILILKMAIAVVEDRRLTCLTAAEKDMHKIRIHGPSV